MMNLQQPVWIKSAVSDFLCRSHLVGNDCLLQTVGMWQRILTHLFLIWPSLLWPVRRCSWADFRPLVTTVEAGPIITKSFPLLLCQYTRYTFLCWAKPLQKMKLHTHTCKLHTMTTYLHAHTQFIQWQACLFTEIEMEWSRKLELWVTRPLLLIYIEAFALLP